MSTAPKDMATEIAVSDEHNQDEVQTQSEHRGQRLQTLMNRIPQLAVLASAAILASYDPNTMGRPQHQ